MATSHFFSICAAVVLAMLGMTVSIASADEHDRQIGLLFEGAFEKADIETKVEGAKKTKLAAAYTWRYGVRLFTDQSWQESGMQWEAFAARAGATADELAKSIEPKYIRDHRGVIAYAIVAGESPFHTSAITSPHFVGQFGETLGDRLHVVVIDRQVLYVFPASGGNLTDFGPALVGIYEKTPLPVSLEVFEVTASGYRVIGEIERAPRE